MPSGPEGVQEISEHTLMHPKTHKMTGFCFGLLFPSTVSSVRVLLAVERHHVSVTLPLFVLLFIALLCIELVFTDI